MAIVMRAMLWVSLLFMVIVPMVSLLHMVILVSMVVFMVLLLVVGAHWLLHAVPAVTCTTASTWPLRVAGGWPCDFCWGLLPIFMGLAATNWHTAGGGLRRSGSLGGS
jgi:hypothetical protein